MNSPKNVEDVMAELGDKFLAAFSKSVGLARSDIDDMRTWRPSWFPGMHSRTLANLIHDRIWSHVVDELEGIEGAEAIEKGPTREIQVGVNLRLRVKRHRDGDTLSMYPTQTAIAFYIQGELALEGLELVTLAAGYRWDSELKEMLAPVISYRDGKDNPIWAVELAEVDVASNVETPIAWTQIDAPDLPEIEIIFGNSIEEDQPDSGTDGQ